MHISIVVRTKNEEKHIDQLLERIRLQKLQANYEIVLVDSGSTDRTLDIAGRYDVRIFSIPAEQFTYGYSLNFGIQNAQGDILVCLSAHCIPCDDLWLSNLTAPIQQGKAHATFGRQVPVQGMNPFEEMFLQRHFPEQECRKGRVSFSNANCAFLRTIWEEMYFDELIPSWEDYLWYLSSKDKYLFRYVPNACVIHSHPFSLCRFRNVAYQDGRAFRYIQERYNVNIIEKTSSFTGKIGYVIRDLSSHTVFFLERGYLRHLAMLPFVKLAAYLSYWKGYHAHTPEWDQQSGHSKL
jgi:rhamnosyltransferase